jgi:hypothetical protein
MITKAIYHWEDAPLLTISWLKKIWNTLDKREDMRFGISAFAFLISIVPTSLAVSFASFTKNDFLLTVALLFSVLTIVFCILVVPLKWTLLCGILSMIASVGTIFYSLAEHWESLEPYVNFLR